LQKLAKASEAAGDKEIPTYTEQFGKTPDAIHTEEIYQGSCESCVPVEASVESYHLSSQIAHGAGFPIQLPELCENVS
jgi:hypothetical protein